MRSKALFLMSLIFFQAFLGIASASTPQTIEAITFWYDQFPASMTTQELYITTDGNNWDLYQTFDEYHECTSTQFCAGSGSNYTKTFNPPLEDILGIQILTTSSSSWVSWFELDIWSYVNTYCEYVLEGECDCNGNVLDCKSYNDGSSPSLTLIRLIMANIT